MCVGRCLGEKESVRLVTKKMRSIFIGKYFAQKKTGFILSKENDDMGSVAPKPKYSINIATINNYQTHKQHIGCLRDLQNGLHIWGMHDVTNVDENRISWAQEERCTSRK